jgi:membrane protein YdbS with pleckstrin-like domain
MMPLESGSQDVTASVADGRAHPLDPRYVSARRIAGGLVVALVAALTLPVVIASLIVSSRPGASALGAGLWVACLVLLVWWTQSWPAVAYRHASYAVDPTGIEIRRGVLWRRVINVPRSRVQHTDVSQGPIERGYELGTLVIYTAGTDHALVQLPGLTHADALRIRDHLLPTGGADAV